MKLLFLFLFVFSSSALFSQEIFVIHNSEGEIIDTINMADYQKPLTPAKLVGHELAIMNIDDGFFDDILVVKETKIDDILVFHKDGKLELFLDDMVYEGKWDYEEEYSLYSIQLNSGGYYWEMTIHYYEHSPLVHIRSQKKSLKALYRGTY